MHLPPLIIFDDDRGELGPMTDLRASFEVRSGMLTTAGRIAASRREPLAGYWVPPRLAAVVTERAGAPVNRLPQAGPVLCANGRWCDPRAALRLEPGTALVDESSGDVVAALLDAGQAEALLRGGALPPGVTPRPVPPGSLYRRPWDVIAGAGAAVRRDLEVMRVVDTVAPSSLPNVVGQEPIEVHATARLLPGVVLDAQQGPIAIHERAVIRAHAVLCGPCSIGRDSVVNDHALIKPNTVIGPACKIGGEVGATIFQGHSNKSHEGHLGDAWVGKWVNFGAGTTSSNLLNTYGEITARLEPDGPLCRTGLTFFGAVVGDHVKLAIGTRLMTGSVLGTGAMIAMTAPPPVSVRRFAWLTDRGEQMFRFDKLLQTATRMMARRDRCPSPAYVDALRALHDEARAARARRTRDGA